MTAMATYENWIQAGLNDQPVNYSDAQRILNDPTLDVMGLCYAAGQIRQHYYGRKVKIHILDNVQNGACPEDCHYCGQASTSDAPVEPYKMKSPEEILADAKEAKEKGAYRFCMVLSGRGPKDRHIDQMVDVIREVKEMGLSTCLSAGLMSSEQTAKLKDAGLDRVNHNLNTSRSHYDKICTTHTYEDRMQTLQAARESGLSLCSGLIVGMHESHDDLLDVAYELNQLKAESIPVNFLLPIEGNKVTNPVSGGKRLTPEYVLRVMCAFRFINPSAEVRIAAGREMHLKSMQPLALWPANSLFLDGYLLTKGSDSERTIRMMLEAGFEPDFDEGAPAAVEQFIANWQAEQDVEGEMPSLDAAELGLKETVKKQPKAPSNFVPADAIRINK